jgi:hypothetical protein
VVLFDNPEHLIICHLSISMVAGLKEFYCLIEMTNKILLCRTIYFPIVSWLLNIFQEITSLETCWAVKEQWENKLSYTVASCLSFLQDLYYDAWIHERLILLCINIYRITRSFISITMTQPLISFKHMIYKQSLTNN